jgi:hypothetical protein
MSSENTSLTELIKKEINQLTLLKTKRPRHSRGLF